jgi:hypothetical protein
MAMLAGVRPALRHVPARPAAHVPAALAASAQAIMADPAVTAVPHSVAAHMAPATAPMRPRAARLAQPHR